MEIHSWVSELGVHNMSINITRWGGTTEVAIARLIFPKRRSLNLQSPNGEYTDQNDGP